MKTLLLLLISFASFGQTYYFNRSAERSVLDRMNVIRYNKGLDMLRHYEAAKLDADQFAQDVYAAVMENMQISSLGYGGWGDVSNQLRGLMDRPYLYGASGEIKWGGDVYEMLERVEENEPPANGWLSVADDRAFDLVAISVVDGPKGVICVILAY